MGRKAKIVLGAITMWPLTYSTWLLLLLPFIRRGLSSPHGWEIQYRLTGLWAGINTASKFLVVLLIVAYSLDTLTNRQLDLRGRFLWLILLVFGNVIIMPVYFVEFVWPERGGWTGEASPRPRSHSCSWWASSCST